MSLYQANNYETRYVPYSCGEQKFGNGDSRLKNATRHSDRFPLQKYSIENNINLNKVIYIGNDVNDLEAMQIVGFPITPADGHARVKRIAKYTTQARGGEGVVRELLDLIN